VRFLLGCRAGEALTGGSGQAHRSAEGSPQLRRDPFRRSDVACRSWAAGGGHDHSICVDPVLERQVVHDAPVRGTGDGSRREGPQPAQRLSSGPDRTRRCNHNMCREREPDAVLRERVTALHVKSLQLRDPSTHRCWSSALCRLWRGSTGSRVLTSRSSHQAQRNRRDPPDTTAANARHKSGTRGVQHPGRSHDSRMSRAADRFPRWAIHSLDLHPPRPSPPGGGTVSHTARGACATPSPPMHPPGRRVPCRFGTVGAVGVLGAR
jgi:hypothetical protein